MPEREEVLNGGIANAGKVVRVDDTVRRPSSRFTDSIFALFGYLHEVGFDGVPRPLGIDGQGREVLSFIQGEVPVPPFPAWSMSDAALASVARLLRRFHEATAGFDASAHPWSDELADPRSGSIVCHNDVCPENTVFRDGVAVAILDWDFAAPGRALWDVAAVMSMWGPVHDPSDPVPGMEGLDGFARARVVADAYGLDEEGRAAIPNVFVDRLELRFVEDRAAAGEQAFIEMLARQGGERRSEQRREWLDANIDRLRDAMS